MANVQSKQVCTGQQHSTAPTRVGLQSSKRAERKLHFREQKALEAKSIFRKLHPSGWGKSGGMSYTGGYWRPPFYSCSKQPDVFVFFLSREKRHEGQKNVLWDSALGPFCTVFFKQPQAGFKHSLPLHYKFQSPCGLPTTLRTASGQSQACLEDGRGSNLRCFEESWRRWPVTEGAVALRLGR